MNLNKLAKQIAEQEGLKESISIAQIKEVLRITLTLLAKEHPADTLAVIRKYENVLDKEGLL